MGAAPAGAAPGGNKLAVANKAKLLSDFQKKGDKLANLLDKWSEADLDKYILSVKYGEKYHIFTILSFKKNQIQSFSRFTI